MRLISEVESRTIKLKAVGKPFGHIEVAETPVSVVVGKWNTCNLVVHNTGAEGIFGGGVANYTGPGSIKFKYAEEEYEIPPGYILRLYYTTPKPNCTRADCSGEILYSTVGSYEIWLVGLHQEDTVWVHDEKKTFNVTAAAAPPTKGKGEIVDVSFPGSAKPMSTVEGSFKVKNVGEAEARFKGTIDDMEVVEKVLKPGETLVVEVSFMMGVKDVKLTLKALRQEDTSWVEDDRETVRVLLEVPALMIAAGLSVVGGLGAVTYVATRPKPKVKVEGRG